MQRASIKGKKDRRNEILSRFQDRVRNHRQNAISQNRSIPILTKDVLSDAELYELLQLEQELLNDDEGQLWYCNFYWLNNQL